MFNRFKSASFLLSACSIVFSQAVQAVEENLAMSSTECLQDINFSAKFLLENDAGIRAKNWAAYPENIQKILDTQKRKMSSVQTVKDCKEIAEPFLHSIRKGHLYLQDFTYTESVQMNKEPDEKVTTKKLSDDTTYIFIPSFDLPIKTQLNKIIQTNQDNITQASYLIIDARKNKGGMDTSMHPVLTLLGEAEYWSEVPQIYSSSTTIQLWKELEKTIPDADAKKWINQINQRMSQHPNDWVSMMENKEISEKIAKADVKSTPKKVVVMIDEPCGSSCEEFVKMVKQNSKVVTIGRTTYGILDASNLRDIKLPSKKIALSYATSYVHRRPGQEIDNIGIPPSIRLPKPNNPQEYDDEVKYAQDYLEQEKWK